MLYFPVCTFVFSGKLSEFRQRKRYDSRIKLTNSARLVTLPSRCEERKSSACFSELLRRKLLSQDNNYRFRVLASCAPILWRNKILIAVSHSIRITDNVICVTRMSRKVRIYFGSCVRANPPCYYEQLCLTPN